MFVEPFSRIQELAASSINESRLHMEFIKLHSSDKRLLTFKEKVPDRKASPLLLPRPERSQFTALLCKLLAIIYTLDVEPPLLLQACIPHANCSRLPPLPSSWITDRIRNKRRTKTTTTTITTILQTADGYEEKLQDGNVLLRRSCKTRGEKHAL